MNDIDFFIPNNLHTRRGYAQKRTTMSNSKKKNKDSTINTTETESNPQISTGEIVLYQPEGEIKLEVRVENETVWLTQAQMAEMFKKDRTVISRHIKNVYKEGELEKSITCANF
jgi:predicted HTH transcriptional regulator